MNKIQEFKQAIRNTPPERLAKIEYQSHILQMLGVSIVCAVFIYNGYWWIILAFIFSLGISMSQAIGAYQKYSSIKELIGDTYNYETDKSPSRKRNYIIEQTFGFMGKVVTLFVSFVICFLLVPFHTWYYKLLFSLCILILYIFNYYIILYNIAFRLWYKKGGDKKDE